MSTELSLDDFVVCLSKELVAIVENPILEGEFLCLSSLPLFLDHGLNYVHDSVVAGPEIGLYFGEYENAIDIDLEGP